MPVGPGGLGGDDAFLILEFVAGNRPVPHPVFAALLAALPSVFPRTSLRLRKALALRSLDAALSESDASTLLHKARAVLAAHPDLASCFPHQLSVPVDRNNAAAVADLRRLLDLQWADLPPSTLEVAADRIAGAGALHTWANADHAKLIKLRLLVGESTEPEILGKLEQGPSMVPEVDKAANVPNTSGVNEADLAQEDDEADLVKENGADHAQEDSTRHQQEPAKGTPDAQLPEKIVTRATVKGKDHVISEMLDKATPSHVTGQYATENSKSQPVTGSKRSLMERNPTASTYEWDDLVDSDPERPSPKRQLPTFVKKTKPSPAFPPKTRKKWSEIQEKTLMEGVEKYGKGNWKDIKMAYPNVFEDRSTVDLKDKFRNMERH